MISGWVFVGAIAAVFAVLSLAQWARQRRRSRRAAPELEGASGWIERLAGEEPTASMSWDWPKRPLTTRAPQLSTAGGTRNQHVSGERDSIP